MARSGRVVAERAFVDRPEAYIPGSRRRALAAGETLPVHVRGAGLFADISGFTPLSEALVGELGSHRASELLTGHLNRIFHAVISELDRFGGDVIYFAGDAITCWLDGDDGLRATACALGMQDAIEREGKITTPGGSVHQLALKVSVATGPALHFVVGDPDVQLIDVLAGRIVDRLAEAEHLASRGEVVLDDEVASVLADRVRIVERRQGGDGLVVALIDGLRVEVEETEPPDEPELPEELARRWLLPAVYERLSTGSGEFLAEFRPAFPFFAGFGGIDFEADGEAVAKLDELVRAAQRVLSSYGGNVLQLSLGDKGAYLYGVFGTPHAHEDDAARACAAAVAFRSLEAETAAREIRIGLTYGRLRSGTYGHVNRRTFVCLGDPVNLAARLMSAAPAGEIYVSELVRRRSGDGFTWEKLPPLQLKGKANPIAAFSLTGLAGGHTRRAIRYELPIVGRTAELKALETALSSAVEGRGRLIGISAEAGMGKSRLIAEFLRDVRRRDIVVALGECQSFGTSASYLVWREIWQRLLGIDHRDGEDAQTEALERALAALDPAFVARAPLFDAMLGLAIPDSDLTREFDAKLRKASLESLVADCLRRRAAAEPVVIVLEDCHWLDPLSRDLLEVVARASRSLPVLVVAAYRPEAASPQGLRLARLPGLEELALAGLGEAEMSSLVRSKLEQLQGESTDAPQSLVTLVSAQAQGNPFYAEELLNFIQAQDVDPADERAVAGLELPDSLHSLILGRIDTLSEGSRRTLKVASVVGRVFEAPILPAVYDELGTLDDVRAHLATLRLLDLVAFDREEDEAYLFKHVVTQQVTYETIPFALREALHEEIGRHIEESDPHAVERNLDLLAHHFSHSGDEAKKREYLLRAGVAAQADYANAAAIDYFERLAPLVAGPDRVGVLLKLGKVLELVGDWERAETVELDGLELARTAGDEGSVAWAETALAEVARKQGRYDEAADRLSRAETVFERLGDAEGAGRVLHLAGTLAAQQGDHPRARARYQASLEIRERTGDRKEMASVLSNLGIVAEYEGENGLARSFHERALELRSEVGDRWAIAVSLTNLGMIDLSEKRHEEARARFDEAMRLSAEAGDSWMVAISHNNLGTALRESGGLAAARDHYAESLHTYRDYDDRWATAFLLEDVALLAAATDEPETALELVGGADRLREEIGSPLAPSLREQLDERLADARARLGGPASGAALERGRELSLAAAVAAALRFCSAGELENAAGTAR